MKKLVQKPVEFHPFVQLTENPLEYRSVKPETRAYIQAAVAIAIPAFGLFCLFNVLVKHPLNIPSYLIAAVVLSVSIAVGTLLSESRGRSSKGFNAIEMLVAANDAIIATIATVGDDDKRNACYASYTRLLRSIYCVAMQIPFTVVFPGMPPSHHYEQLLACFEFDLKEAGLENIVCGPNGRLHQILQARSAIKMLVTVTISQSMYVAVGVLFALSYTTIVLGTARVIPWYIGASLTTAAAYGIGLLIFIAWNTSVPFGSRVSEVEIPDRFRSIEVKNQAAMNAGNFLREMKAKKLAPASTPA